MPKTARTLWAWTVATFFGAGFLKPGPGTYGSVATVLLWLAAASLLHHNRQHLLIATLIALTVSIAAGIPAATRVAREAQRKDPGFVVIDEVAGQLVVLIGLTPDWPRISSALRFSSFRFFDILKPPSASAGSKRSPRAPELSSTISAPESTL